MAILLTLILASFVLLAFRIVRRRKRESYAAIQAGCGEVETFWSKDPLFHMDFTVKSHLDQNLTKRCHAQHGATYLVDSLFDITSLHTIAPENLAALHSQGKEYGVQALRLAGMELFCGHGLLTTDGALWSKSRKMLKPTFDRANISDLGFLDRETDALFAKIEDGTTIDLQEHLFLMFAKTSIRFLLGIDTAAESKGAPCTAEEFIQAFHASLFGTGMRIVLGPMRFLVKFKAPRERAHAYLDYYVQQALSENSSSPTTAGGSAPGKGSLVKGLAAQTDDTVYMRNQILQGMMASQETTAVLIANCIFLLARHKDHWEQLRATVRQRDEDLFTFEHLSNFALVQNIIAESLRLYPIFPIMARIASTDTTLPVGGGPNKDQPVYVAKGSRVQTSFVALHRNPSVFSTSAEDADMEAFIPERWNKIRPKQWEYMPFGGGNRACLGREKVLAETAFVLCRLAQRFEKLESRDKNPWKGHQTLTAKNANGCKVALYRA